MKQESIFESHVDEYEQWFQEHSCLFAAEIAAIREVLPTSGVGLEIGVGSGLFASALGIKYGVEPSAAMRKKAESRGVHVFDGVAERLPFKTAMFDFAVMITVDCFLTDVWQSFQEAFRILVPQGCFVIAFIDSATRLGDAGRLPCGCGTTNHLCVRKSYSGNKARNRRGCLWSDQGPEDGSGWICRIIDCLKKYRSVL